jgi:threonine dehydratase
MTTYELPLEAIQQARVRIAPYIRHTPLLPLPLVQPGVPVHLRLKLENLQVSGSFKPRGVLNHLLQLDPEQRQRGVIASSGGNHGLAVAQAARRLSIPAVVYLPETASPDRVARIRATDVQMVQHGSSWDMAHSKALEQAEAEGLYYIHPFDDDKTLAGQGTLGLELLEDVPAVDCVLIAIGGGGLICGMAAALKQQRPQVRIIGVEARGIPAMQRSLHAGQVVRLPETAHTIADTLAPRAVSERTRSLAAQYVDEIVLVDDRQMIAAQRWLWREGNQLVEPAGAAVLAALLTGAADVRAATHPVALICGGNAAAGTVFAAYDAQVG